MTREPSRRPATLKPPAHLSPNTPVPAPSREAPMPEPGLSPTRYGDWEKKGIAIAF